MELRPIFSALLRSKTAPFLIAIQVAISLAILANALYIVNLRQATAQRPSGIEHESDVLTLTVRTVPRQSQAELLAQQQRDVAALAAIPGVTAASWVSQMPMSRSGSNSSFALDRKQARSSLQMSTYFATSDAMKTMGLKLVEGRDFTENDVVVLDADADDPGKKFPGAVILTKAAADFLYPGTSAVGKTLLYGTGDDAAETRVIGVVERLQTIIAETGPQGEYSVLIPWRTALPYAKYVVRAQPLQRDRVLADAENVLRTAAPVPRIIKTRTVSQDRNDRYRNERALAWMLIAVSVLLLLVTASGIVGMTALRVAQRRKQIGIRRALGARRADILRYFVSENLMITTTGIAAGIVLTLALNQLLVRQLELPRLPAAYMLGGMAVLWLLGILAVAGPAWRAACVPPATATRSV